ncbi:MAG TPA: GyrI-like domain-containing protein [Rhizobiaceae bacterium]|nr:GyrI-like domain-containing protein [Rhizobiaceae bacterium]
MCEWCGAPAGLLDGFSVVERPAQTLVGRVWEGTYSQAAGGALHPVLAKVQAQGTGEGKQAGAALWAGPIVGISWNDRPDGFRYFVGIESDAVDAEKSPLKVPAMRFATAWHDASDGDVTEHYQLMLQWMEREGLSWDKSRMHHREEYPLHADFSAPPMLRLMVPVR